MLDWISSLFGSKRDDIKLSSVDQELLLCLRDELKQCEALYRAGAQLCRQTCPGRIDGDPSKFPELMLDLHRGLLIKIFVEIASSDRRWHPAEREMALVLLRHVWGVDVDKENLIQALRNVRDHAEMLKWESLLGPFVEMPPLANQGAELKTNVMRIANLIAKADGNVLPCEVSSLKSIQTSVENVLRLRRARPKQARANVSQVGREVAQLVQAQPAGRSGHDTKKPAAPVDEKTALPDQKSREKMFVEAMDELDELIGLDAVKKDIGQLVNFLKVQEKRQRHKLPQTAISLHTVFCGNPGTGKTTVARILARIFCGLQILDKGHTVETDRSGLVAEYSGQTGPKVNKRVDEALDGVLFVDEAYSLIAESGDDPFGSEAIQVLLKRMEDDRKRLVVVLAGYPRPMQRMLRSNPGLTSRFQRTFDFSDYTAGELVQIFECMCKKNQYILAETAREKLRADFQSLIDHRDERFGNGRLARNLFEDAIRLLANRIVDISPVTRKLLTRLEPEDIQIETRQRD